MELWVGAGGGRPACSRAWGRHREGAAATWPSFPPDQPGGRPPVPVGAPALGVPGGTRLRSREEECRAAGWREVTSGKQQDLRVEAAPPQPQPQPQPAGQMRRVGSARSPLSHGARGLGTGPASLGALWRASHRLVRGPLPAHSAGASPRLAASSQPGRGAWSPRRAQPRLCPEVTSGTPRKQLYCSSDT